jgi:SAM-dependent methyltransferase
VPYAPLDFRLKFAVSEQPLPGPSDYDAELRLHDEVLRRAYDVQPWHHVLDIGCGTGQTTRDAARIAQAGSASGVDIRASAIERAHELARKQEVRNVTFQCADAQVHRFPQERFDLAISRFGTMFFADLSEPVYYRPDSTAALAWVQRFKCASDALSRLDPAAAARALGRLRDVFTAHMSDNGIWFGSRAWIVTARLQ